MSKTTRPLTHLATVSNTLFIRKKSIRISPGLIDLVGISAYDKSTAFGKVDLDPESFGDLPKEPKKETALLSVGEDGRRLAAICGDQETKR